MNGAQFVDKHDYFRTTNGRPYIYTRKIAICGTAHLTGARTLCPSDISLHCRESPDVPLIYGFFYSLRRLDFSSRFNFYFCKRRIFLKSTLSKTSIIPSPSRSADSA